MICGKIEEGNHYISLAKVQLKKSVTFSEFKLICNIPGTSQLNMALLIELDGDIGRFDNYKQVDAYL